MDPFLSPPQHEALVAAARAAAARAYAPYSRLRVGAALLFADGAVVSGANVENASLGLSLCAETSAVAAAMNAGRRGGLVAVAVVAERGEATDPARPHPGPVTPCGRCRQVLGELAALDGADPLILCVGAEETAGYRLGALLPHAFGMPDPA